MGKKSGPKQPTPPDPYEIARADSEFNRINQNTPFGSLEFSGENNNIANMTFSPEIQALFDQQTNLSGQTLDQAGQRLAGLDQNPIDMSMFNGIQQDAGLSEFNPTGLPEVPGDFNQLRKDQEDAFFQRGRRLLEPQFQRQNEGLQQQLANQGLVANDEASLDQFDQFNDNRNRTFQDLADQSIQRGGDEMQRELANILSTRGQLFGEQFQESGFNNNVRQQGLQNNNAGRLQGLQEQLGSRGQQFNEFASLMGLGQTQMPGLENFFGPGQTDFLGAQALNQQQQNNNFNASTGNKNAGLGGLFGLGSSLITGAGNAGGFGNLFGGNN